MFFSCMCGYTTLYTHTRGRARAHTHSLATLWGSSEIIPKDSWSRQGSDLPRDMGLWVALADIFGTN